MAEPHVGYLGVIDLSEDHLGDRERVISLNIKRDRHAGAGCEGDKVGPVGNVLWKVPAVHFANGTRAAYPPADFAVMVKDCHAIARTPHVALDAGGAEAYREIECRHGVLWCMSTSAAMGEQDGRIEERRELLLHEGASSHGHRLMSCLTCRAAKF